MAQLGQQGGLLAEPQHGGLVEPLLDEPIRR